MFEINGLTIECSILQVINDLKVALERNGMNFNDMWVRNRTTKTNGVSYIIQKGGAAVFT